MEKPIILRISETLFRSLQCRFQGRESDNEEFAVLLCGRAEGLHEIVYVCSRALFPDSGDLEAQSPVGVTPSR